MAVFIFILHGARFNLCLRADLFGL
jgi:hypothetical protein